MNKTYYMWYRMAVLAYYRCEWTDISDEDYRLAITADLNLLIKNCCHKKTTIPNAAKEVDIYIKTFEMPKKNHKNKKEF